MIILQSVLEILMVLLIYAAGFSIFFFSHPRISRYYQEWKWKRENEKHNQWRAKIFEETLQRERKRKLHEKEMEKYPLFFWKELNNGSS